MPRPEAVLRALWFVWAMGWIVASRWTARTAVRPPGLSRFAHVLLLFPGGMLVFAGSDRLDLLGPRLFPPSPATRWAAVALCAAGLGLAAWARLHIGRLWSGSVVLKEDHALVRSGPYAWTRHPIYTGLLLALAGTTLDRDTVGAVIGLGLCLAALVVKLRQEERLLVAHFGPAYEAYRAEVPALVPGIG